MIERWTLPESTGNTAEEECYRGEVQRYKGWVVKSVLLKDGGYGVCIVLKTVPGGVDAYMPLSSSGARQFAAGLRQMAEVAQKSGTGYEVRFAFGEPVYGELLQAWYDSIVLSPKDARRLSGAVRQMAQAAESRNLEEVRSCE